MIRLKLYSGEDSYDRKQYFASVKTILNILARLAVFIDDTNIISFLEILSKFSKNGDVFVDRDIRKILQIISKRFNGSIANTCQNIIFLEFNAQYHLASYFDGISFEISKDDMDMFYTKALQLSSSENMLERDNGVREDIYEYIVSEV